MLALTRLFPELRLGAIRERLALMETVRRERAALRDLPHWMLKDVGLDPRDARCEWGRPLWDVENR